MKCLFVCSPFVTKFNHYQTWLAKSIKQVSLRVKLLSKNLILSVFWLILGPLVILHQHWRFRKWLIIHFHLLCNTSASFVTLPWFKKKPWRESNYGRRLLAEIWLSLAAFLMSHWKLRWAFTGNFTFSYLDAHSAPCRKTKTTRLVKCCLISHWLSKQKAHFSSSIYGTAWKCTHLIHSTVIGQVCLLVRKLTQKGCMKFYSTQMLIKF